MGLFYFSAGYDNLILLDCRGPATAPPGKAGRLYLIEFNQMVRIGVVMGLRHCETCSHGGECRHVRPDHLAAALIPALTPALTPGLTL